MTLWREVDRWRYYYYEPDVDPAIFPEFAGLLEIWQSKRNGRRVPAWKDFDFYDFVGWHGKLSIYEIRYEPYDYTVRLSGTHIDEMYQRTMKGIKLDDMRKMFIEQDNSEEFYEMACRNLCITHTFGPLNVKNLDYKEVEFFELPLSDDGIRATHTIEAALPVGQAGQQSG